jgi:hypothetical protein
MTTIHSNGSKWAGQQPDSIETLLAVLAETPLDPAFENYGAFFYRLDDPEHGYPTEKDRGTAAGVVQFFGNFFNLSHGFTIDSDDPETVTALSDAIRANMAGEAYQAVRRKYNPCPKCDRLRDGGCRCEGDTEGGGDGI